MTSARWTPHVIATALIEDAGRYLLVEEHTRHGLRLNTPGGHLEPGESAVDAAAREALEESARPFRATHLVGLYLTSTPDISYLRLAFAGEAGATLAGRALDRNIVRTLWLTVPEVQALQLRLRAPAVLQSIADHAAGQRFPLTLLHSDPAPTSGLTRAA